MFNTLQEAQEYHALLVRELGHANTLTAIASLEVSAHLDGTPPVTTG